jgi:hypothetical protein
MIRILQSPGAVALIGALAYIATTILAWQPVVRQVAASVPPPVKIRRPAVEFPKLGDPELDQLVTSLRQRKTDLDTRENNLQAWEARLQGEKEDIARLTGEVERRQKEFDQLVLRIREDEPAQLKKLARIYVAMTPATAADVLNQMNDADLLKLMALMKESELVPLLETLAKRGTNEMRRVALLSERLRLTLAPSTTRKP